MIFSLYRHKFTPTVFSMFGIASVWCLPQAALALCTASNSNLVFSLSPLQRDASLGTIIGTATATTNISCTPTGAVGEWRVALSSSNSDYGATSLANVRQTNRPGVGIRWRNTSGATGTTQSMSSNAINNINTYRGIPSSSVGNYTFTDVFELIKVGPTTSGVLPSWTLAYDYRTANGTSQGRLIQFNFTDTVIKQTACTVTNSSLNVPMGNVLRSVFTGVGSASPVKDFSVSLNCDARVNPNITINATADSSGAIGVMALDVSTNNAIGVGIQILRNGAPIALNNQSNTGATSASGIYNIPLQARYYQTLATIIGGRANGTATFTMTYN